MKSLSSAAVVAFSLASPVFAEGFADINKKAEFVSLISGKALTRFGISLNVSPKGAIEGSAFGQPVTGKWRWADGLFCRDLYFGKKDLGPNCQLVQRKGDTIRFIADAGKGEFADLKLK